MPRPVDPRAEILRRRLAAQRLSGPGAATPAELVRWMGAVQAQDYAGGLWAIGMRCRAAVEADVERAVAERTIVRTWPMRGTLHLVPAEDARWMLSRLAPRVLSGMRGRLRQLGLEDRDLAKARRLLTRALSGGRSLSRPAAYAALERGGVSPAGQRGIHVLAVLALHGVLCCGPREGRQPTFVLLDEWVPAWRETSGEEALATLARRYFRGHGPATLADFSWWTGLRVAEARRAVAAAGADLRSERRGDLELLAASDEPAAPRASGAALLPPWDEFLVGYRDRSAAVGHLADHDDRRLELVGSPIVLAAGRAQGTWRRTVKGDSVRVRFSFFAPPDAAVERSAARAAARYAAFLGRALTPG